MAKPKKQKNKKSGAAPHAWRMSRLKLITDRPAHKALEFSTVDMYSVLQQPEFHGIRSVDLAFWKVRHPTLPGAPL